MTQPRPHRGLGAAMGGSLEKPCCAVPPEAPQRAATEQKQHDVRPGETFRVQNRSGKTRLRFRPSNLNTSLQLVVSC